MGASDDLPNILLCKKMFMELHGYKITQNMFDQDIESDIWLNDRADAKDITIWHCPALHKLANFLPNHY